MKIKLMVINLIKITRFMVNFINRVIITHIGIHNYKYETQFKNYGNDFCSKKGSDKTVRCVCGFLQGPFFDQKNGQNYTDYGTAHKSCKKITRIMVNFINRVILLRMVIDFLNIKNILKIW